MPISAANLELYPGGVIGSRPADVLGADVVQAIESLRRVSGHDALFDPGFWEQHVAQRLGGDRTSARASHDVEVTIWGVDRKAEVKFSRAFFADYGKHSRYIFKWMLTKHQVSARAADAIILIGVDIDRAVYSWVLATKNLAAGKRSITVTAPHARRTRSNGRIDRYFVPTTELLPGFARACDAPPPSTLLDLMGAPR